MSGGAVTEPASTERWVSYRRPNAGARLRLFCLPYAGGGASVYRSWHTSVSPDVEVCPVQPPGRENRIRETPFTDTESLVEAIDEALGPLLDRPFVLFGYSMGATIAFEWAQRLRRQRGVVPERLIVAARAAPQVPRQWPAMYRLPDDELKKHLLELAGTPPEILDNEELMEILLPLLRADFEIHDTYRPSSLEPLPCPIDAFGGLDDPAVPLEHLEAWSEVTNGPYRLRRLPGDHFGLLRGERLTEEIDRLLRTTLSR